MTRRQTTPCVGVMSAARSYADSSEVASAVDTEGGSTVSAVMERPAVTMTAAPVQPATGKDACALALGYLRWASACWRDDGPDPAFATRLGAYWRPVLPPMPAGEADAVSPHGGGGRGIHWYQTDAEVFGYIPGAGGGYQVPRAAIPQLMRCAPIGPCAKQAGITRASGLPWIEEEFERWGAAPKEGSTS